MGTTAEKLTYLNTTKQLIKESINLTDANITTQPFRQYATILKHRLPEIVGDPSIIWNNYEHVTGTGTSFSITAYNSIIEYQLKGNTTQTGTPTPDAPVPVNVVSGDNTIDICGKNLFDIDNAFHVSISGNGAVGNNEDYRTTDYLPTQPNTSYYFSTTQISGQTSKQIYIAYYDSNKTFISRTSYNLLESAFTTPTNTYFIRAGVYSKGQENVMLEKGSTKTTYEPYMGSSYPLYLGVENLKNSNNIISGYFDTSTTTISTSPANKTIYCNVEPNTTYYVSKLRGVRSFVGTTTTLPAIGVSVSNIKNIGTSGYDGTTVVSGTITTGANDKYLVFNYVNTNSESGDIETSIYNSLIIIKGSTLQYISDNPIELCKIGTYQDYIYKDNGSWYLHKEIGKVVLDGSENWYVNNQTYRINNFGAKPFSSFSVDNVLAYSNYFKWLNGNSGTFVDGAMWYILSGNELCLQKDQNPTSTTLATFKTWLSTHNTEVYYVLANPTTEEIKNYELFNQLNALSLYTGTNTITVTSNDLPATLDLTAIKYE